LFLVHANAAQTPDGRARKLERDLRILYKELEERPEHSFALFNLGMTYRDATIYGACRPIGGADTPPPAHDVQQLR